MPVDNASHWHQLPKEILALVAQLVEQRDAFALALTCTGLLENAVGPRVVARLPGACTPSTSCSSSRAWKACESVEYQVFGWLAVPGDLVHPVVAFPPSEVLDVTIVDKAPGPANLQALGVWQPLLCSVRPTRTWTFRHEASREAVTVALPERQDLRLATMALIHDAVREGGTSAVRAALSTVTAHPQLQATLLRVHHRVPSLPYDVAKRLGSPPMVCCLVELRLSSPPDWWLGRCLAFATALTALALESAQTMGLQPAAPCLDGLGRLASLSLRGYRLPRMAAGTAARLTRLAVHGGGDGQALGALLLAGALQSLRQLELSSVRFADGGAGDCQDFVSRVLAAHAGLVSLDLRSGCTFPAADAAPPAARRRVEHCAKVRLHAEYLPALMTRVPPPPWLRGISVQDALDLEQPSRWRSGARWLDALLGSLHLRVRLAGEQDARALAEQLEQQRCDGADLTLALPPNASGWDAGAVHRLLASASAAQLRIDGMHFLRSEHLAVQAPLPGLREAAVLVEDGLLLPRLLGAACNLRRLDIRATGPPPDDELPCRAVPTSLMDLWLASPEAAQWAMRQLRLETADTRVRPPASGMTTPPPRLWGGTLWLQRLALVVLRVPVQNELDVQALRRQQYPAFPADLGWLRLLLPRGDAALTALLLRTMANETDAVDYVFCDADTRDLLDVTAEHLALLQAGTDGAPRAGALRVRQLGLRLGAGDPGPLLRAACAWCWGNVRAVHLRGGAGAPPLPGGTAEAGEWRVPDRAHARRTTFQVADQRALLALCWCTSAAGLVLRDAGSLELGAAVPRPVRLVPLLAGAGAADWVALLPPGTQFLVE